MEERIIELFTLSSRPDNEALDLARQIYEKISPVPEFPLALFNMLDNDQIITKWITFCSTYIYKSVSDQWAARNDSWKTIIFQNLMQRLFKPQLINHLSSIAGFISCHSPPEIANSIYSQMISLNCRSISLLHEISISMHEIININPLFAAEICYNSLSDNGQCVTAVQIISTIGSNPIFQPCVDRIVQVSGSITDKEFWGQISVMVSLFSPEQQITLCQSAFSIAQNGELEPDVRAVPLFFCSQIIGSVNPNLVPTFISLTFDVACASLVQFEQLPESVLSQLEFLFDDLPHLDLYACIRDRLLSAFQSEDLMQISVAMLTFSIILDNAPAQVYSDIQFFYAAVQASLSSEIFIVQEAACKTITHFSRELDGIEGLAQSLMPQIVQLFNSQSYEVKTVSFTALESLLKISSVNLEFLELIWSTRPSIDPEHFEQYLSCLALVVENEIENADSILSEIFGFIVHLLQQPDDLTAASALPLLSSLLHFQLPFDVNQLLPVIQRCLQSSSETQELAIIFLRNAVFSLQALDLFRPFIEFISSIIQNDESSTSIRACSINALSMFCHYSNQFIPELFGKIMAELNRERQSSQKIILESARLMVKLLPNECALQLFDFTVDKIKTDVRFTKHYFNTLKKLIKSPSASNIQHFAQESECLIAMFFAGSLPTMEGNPFEESISPKFLDAFCGFVSNFWQFNSSNNQLWLNKFVQYASFIDEMNRYAPIGAIADSFKQQIDLTPLFQILPDMIQTASNTNLMSNLLYLLIKLLENRPQPDVVTLAQNCIPVFLNQWWNITSLHENISVFIIRLAMRGVNFSNDVLDIAAQNFPLRLVHITQEYGNTAVIGIIQNRISSLTPNQKKSFKLE